MSRQKELVKNTAILAFGRICTQCISFILLPLYTSILDAKDYGIFDLFCSYLALLVPLASWQLDQGVFRFMLEYRKNLKKQQELFTVATILSIFQIFICGILYLICMGFCKSKYKVYLMISIVTLIFLDFFLQFIRGLGKNIIYAMASFLTVFISILLNIFTLLVLKLGVLGLFYSNIIAQIVTVFYLFISQRLWRYFKISTWNSTMRKDLMGYSMPLIPNNLAWWMVNVSDRTIVSKVLGVAANGIYSVANKFPNVFIQFYNIFNLSWTETVSLHYKDEDRDSFLSNTMTTLFNLFAAACFGIVACIPFVFPILINSKFHAAYNQIPILMYGMLFRVLVGLYSVVYIAQKRSIKIAQTSIIAAIINVITDLLLIGIINLYAASISTLIAFIAMFLIRYHDINREIHMQIRKKNIAVSIALLLFLTITYYSGLVILNVLGLIASVVYAIYFNYEIALSGLRTLKNMFQKLIQYC